jgi:2,3-bisphosphoglycerate-independent phosphoglycerate mutase
MIILDGLSDVGSPALNGKTPLQAAYAPHLHYLGTQGRVLRIDTTFEGFPVESMVCIMGLLGYEPQQFYPAGRASFEALAKGIPLSPRDLILRCNTVTIDPQTRQLTDFTAGMIRDAAARRIVSRIQLPNPTWELYPGQSYRNILVIRDAGVDPRQITCAPPHQHVGEYVESMLPTSTETAAQPLMEALREFLLSSHAQIGAMDHDEEIVANMLWVWSPAERATWPSFRSRTGMRGAVVGGLDFLHGIAMAADMFVEVIPGATGEIESNLAAKAEHAARYLERFDFVLAHVNATDEAAHQKDPDLKRRAIERADRELVGPLLRVLHERHAEAGFRVLVCGDHMTRSTDGRHVGLPVPAAMFGAGIVPSGATAFSETEADRCPSVPSLEILKAMQEAR